MKFDWLDAKRNRTVPVKIYAPREGSGPFPILIFSHGLGGSRDGYEYLGRHWAGAGYVSVHLQHHGSDESVWKNAPAGTRSEALRKSGVDLTNAINRPLDARFAIDEVLKLNETKSSSLKGRLDPQRIGIAGHSFGGYTALAVAGQTFINARASKSLLRDSRVTAAIQMSAPAFRNRENLDDSYGSITIPVMHLTGTRDYVPIFPETTVEDRRLPFDHMHNAETCFVNFTDGDHMIFSGTNRLRPEEREQDAQFQKLICVATTAFWDAYLRKSQTAKVWLYDGGFKQALGDAGQFEKKQPSAR